MNLYTRSGRSIVVVVVAVAVAVADGDHSGHGHDLLRLSRDSGGCSHNATQANFW